MEKVKRKKRFIQPVFDILIPSKDFSYPVLVLKNVKDIDINEIITVILHRDPDTKEWVIFLVKKNDDFWVFHIPDAVAWLLDEKVKSAIILMNVKSDNIEDEEGIILSFGRKIDDV